MEELSNYTDAMKMETKGLREKGETWDRQILVMIDSSNENKNKFKNI